MDVITWLLWIAAVDLNMRHGEEFWHQQTIGNPGLNDCKKTEDSNFILVLNYVNRLQSQCKVWKIILILWK